MDDLVITGTHSSKIEAFKLQMAEVFKMSDLGMLTYYLGIEVKQDEKGITLSPGSYAQKILEKGGGGGLQSWRGANVAKVETEQGEQQSLCQCN